MSSMNKLSGIDGSNSFYDLFMTAALISKKEAHSWSHPTQVLEYFCNLQAKHTSCLKRQAAKQLQK